MADNYRHRREVVKVRHLPVASATVVEIGDLVWIDTNEAKPASSFTWDANIATTQNAFVAKFLGMSPDRSRAGDTEALRIEKSGVKEFDCASATFVLGDLVGPAKATGDALENQKVVAVATSNLAIGRVAKHYSIATTRVEVEIFGILDSMLVAGAGATLVAAVNAGDHKILTDAEYDKLDNIDLGATADTDDEIVALVEAANPKLTADAIQDGTTNKAFTGVEQLKLAAIPGYEELTHEFDLAVDDTWADAIPAGSVIRAIRYINNAAVTSADGADAYKIDLSGGTTADLVASVAFPKNTKANASINQACAGTTAVNITPLTNTISGGTVTVGLTVNKRVVVANYAEEV